MEYSWNSSGFIDLAFVSAATSESDSAKLHVGCIIENAVALSAGLCLWVAYGFAKDDWVIILANPIGVMLSLAVLCFKIRDLIS
jgi:uncharacterized protein with PQ loop repeat